MLCSDHTETRDYGTQLRKVFRVSANDLHNLLDDLLLLALVAFHESLIFFVQGLQLRVPEPDPGLVSVDCDDSGLAPDGLLVLHCHSEGETVLGRAKAGH